MCSTHMPEIDFHWKVDNLYFIIMSFKNELSLVYSNKEE